jgi:hypothetical protein
MTIRTESRITVAAQIHRVSNIEMAAIKAAVESDVQAGAGSP